MEDPKPSTDSDKIREPELRFPAGDSPKPHPPRTTDPRAVAKHFAPLLEAIERPTAEQRLADKVDVPFRL